METCIICGGKIIVRCKCIRNDSTCENGHRYHYSPHFKEYHAGDSDHSQPDENCCEEKIKIEK